MPKGPKPFVKGQSGNPNGRPKGMLHNNEIRAILGKFFRLSRDQLQAIINDPKSPMGEIMIASVMVQAVKTGDSSRLDMLLNRGVGKVKEVIEQTNINVPSEDLEEIPTDKLLKVVSQ